MSLAVLARKTRATVNSRNTRTSEGQFSLNSKLPVNRNCGFQCGGVQPLALPNPSNRQISNGSLLRRRVNGLQHAWQTSAIHATNNPPTEYMCAQQHTVADKKTNLSSMDRSSDAYIKLIVNQHSHTDRKNVTNSEWLEKLKKSAQPPEGETCSNTCDNIQIYKGPFGGYESGQYLRTINSCELKPVCVVKGKSVGIPGCNC